MYNTMRLAVQAVRCGCGVAGCPAGGRKNPLGDARRVRTQLRGGGGYRMRVTGRSAPPRALVEQWRVRHREGRTSLDLVTYVSWASKLS